jgi:hypothetical protein
MSSRMAAFMWGSLSACDVSGNRTAWHSASSVSPAHCVGKKARGTQAGVALRSFRVPRPGTPYGRARPLAQMRTASATADACASSFTYRNGAPRRPASANDVGAQRAFSHGTASKVGSKGIACIRHSVFAHQPCRQPGAVGWMFPVGKGGARSSGRGTRTETSAPLTSATTTAGTPSGSRKSPATKASAPMLANKTYFTWSKP